MFLFPVSSHTRGTRNLHLNDLLSTNQHILLNVNEKRRLSAHCAPSPLPQSSASLSFVPHSLSFFESLPFFLPLVSPSLSSISCLLTLPSKYASAMVCGHLFSCWVDVCKTVGACVEPACYSSTRSLIFFSPFFLFALFSLGHMVLPKGKSELSTRTHPQTARAFLVR